MTPRRRRPSSSGSTPRPRRLAGQSGPVPPEPEPEPTTEPATDPSAEPVAVDEPEAEQQPEPESEPELLDSATTGPEEPVEQVELAEPVEHRNGAELRGLIASRRTTTVLLVVIAVLAAASLAGGGYLLFRDDGDEGIDPAGRSNSSILQISPDDAQVAAAAAGQAAYTIIATSWRNYDAQVEEAVSLMTPGFAEEYRKTAEDARQGIVENRTEVQVSVITQGVVSANDADVRVLVFLNQIVTKQGDEKATLTPYRVLVTMANTDDGWLVSALDTK